MTSSRTQAQRTHALAIVMDTHFVPNITISPPVMRASKGIATRPLDVHLMIEAPDC